MTLTIAPSLRFICTASLIAAATLFLATAAHAQVNQCVTGRISSQECWIGIQLSGNTIIVTPSDVAVNAGTKLSWKRTDTPTAPAQPDFAVDFTTDCTPFHGVVHFDQSSASPLADDLPASQFERCKYKVTIGSLTVDSHVIVIGETAKHHGQSWRRHLGDW